MTSVEEGESTKRVSRQITQEEQEERRRIQKILQEKASNEQKKLALTKLIHDVSKTCFQKCVEKPGLKLSNHERNCVNFCASRYLESSALVANRALKAFASEWDEEDD